MPIEESEFQTVMKAFADVYRKLEARDDLTARLAAAEARVKEMEYERNRRIYWQDLTYAAMTMIDKLLGCRVTEDTFKAKLAELQSRVTLKDAPDAKLSPATLPTDEEVEKYISSFGGLADVYGFVVRDFAKWLRQRPGQNADAMGGKQK